MAVNGLRDQDRLEGASNFVNWKARILAILDKHRIKGYALKTIAVPVDPNANEKYEEAMGKAKCMILDRSRIMSYHISLRRTQQMRCGRR